MPNNILKEFLSAARLHRERGWPCDLAVLARAEVMYSLLTTLSKDGCWSPGMLSQGSMLHEMVRTLLTDMKKSGFFRLKCEGEVKVFEQGKDSTIDDKVLENLLVLRKACQLKLKGQNNFFNIRQCELIIKAIDSLSHPLSRAAHSQLKGEIIRTQELTIRHFAYMLENCCCAMLKEVVLKAALPNKENIQKHALQFYVHALVIRELCRQGKLNENGLAKNYLLHSALLAYMQQETKLLGIRLKPMTCQSSLVPLFTCAQKVTQISPWFKGEARKRIQKELIDTAWDAGIKAGKVENKQRAESCMFVAKACGTIVDDQVFALQDSTLLKIKPFST